MVYNYPIPNKKILHSSTFNNLKKEQILEAQYFPKAYFLWVVKAEQLFGKQIMYKLYPYFVETKLQFLPGSGENHLACIQQSSTIQLPRSLVIQKWL